MQEQNYLNEKTIRRESVIAFLEIFVGIAGILFWGFGLFIVMAGIATSDYPWLFVLIIPHAVLLHFGRKRRKRIRKAKKINTFLVNDTDGMRYVRDLARDLETDFMGLLSELKFMFQKEYFENCILETGNTPALYFPVSEKAQALAPRKRIVTVRCPNCGASNQLIAGRTGKCEYCDNPIS